MRGIVEEIAREEGLKLRVALVRGEQDKKYLKTKYRQRRIRPLDPAPPVSEEIIDRSAHIVALHPDQPARVGLRAGLQHPKRTSR